MKLNSVTTKTAGLVVLTMTIYWLSGTVLVGKGPQNGDFKLYAASIVQSGKAEVRLRWFMKTGWLPEGGVNIYRNEPGGKEVLLNPAIMGANPGKLANNPWKVPANPKASEGKSKEKLQYTYQDALKLVASNQDKIPLAVFSPAANRLDSAFSAKAFQQLGQLRVKQLNLPEVNPLAKVDPQAQHAPHMVVPDAASYPELAQYEEHLGYEPAAPAVRKYQKADPEAPISMLRTNLVLGAMLHPNTIGNDLGLAFTDTTAEAGKSYHYTLKVVEKGNTTKQTTVAERDVIVQNDPPLNAPTGLQGFQYDATTVCLRWNRVEQTDSLGLVSYDLVRIDNANPAGKKVNDLPILIRDLTLSKKVGVATRMEPMVLYHDTTSGTAAPGQVTYQLVAIDLFGRRSSATTTAVKLEDLVAPPPVGHIAAEPAAKGGKVQVLWTALEQPDVLYLASRIDAETGTETKLGQMAGDPPTLTDYPELAAMEKHVGMRRMGTLKKDAPMDQTKWLGFTDTPPEDHYFIYKVKAVYKTHPRESLPQFTKAIPVPSLKAPAAPTVLASYVPADKLPKTTERPSGERFSKPGFEKGKESGKFEFSKVPDLASAKPADLAGAVQLRWNPVLKAQAYRIYRASGTGFRPGAMDTVSDLKNPVVQVGIKGKFQYRSEISDTELKDGQFSLVGQVDGKFEFLDYVSRSPAHVYWYRVVAVNRWGAPAATAAATSQAWSKAVKALVPGTVPPAAPVLIAATPDFAGNLQLTLAAPSATDAAVNYRVYRDESTQTSNDVRLNKIVVFKDHKQVLVDKGQRKGDEIILVDKLVQAGRLYEYYVVADNGETTPVLSPASGKLRSNTFKSLAIAPTEVTAVKKGDQVMVQWKGVANAAGYIVERSHTGSPKAEFAQVSNLQPGLVFIDPAPGPGPAYTYRVIAVDTAGNVSDPRVYPLDQQIKDPSKYPAQATVTVKGP